MVIGTKRENVGSIPGAHIVGKGTNFHKLSYDLHMYVSVHM